jgi:hypothetical protein
VCRKFFENFPLVLMGQVASEMIEEDSLPEVAIWKALGDELIFTCKPQSAEETTLLIRALFFSMAIYEREYLKELPLRLKGSVWIAEFPAPNIEIEIPEMSEGGGRHIDFIGPGIDLGFRIGKFSRPSALVVSLELLEVVLSARNAKMLAFSLIGREELKGVLHGRPYPIVWCRPTEAAYDFMPWELDDCPLMRKAAADKPATRKALQTQIENVRQYLRRMWGVHTRPMTFAPAEQVLETELGA